jgi:dipeptidyl-peptidase-4
MRYFLGLLFLFTGFVLKAQESNKTISLEDIWKNNVFAIKTVPGFNTMNDGLHYTQLDRVEKHQCINIYDLASGEKRATLFNTDSNLFAEQALNIESYEFSADESKLMLFTEGEHIYRRSALYKVYIYDIKSKLLQILEYDKVLHATFSPNGQLVAFVKDNNLYYRNLAESKTYAITSDGAKNKIINGNCDWVYEEEFGFTKAFNWAPDSKTIAYYRFDESKVKEYTMPKYDSLYPTLYTYKYPKAGEDNSKIEIHMVDILTKLNTAIDLGKEQDIYIPRIKWTKDPAALCVYRLNRLQNHLELLLVNAQKRNTTLIYKEDNACYIEINDELKFLPDLHSFIFTSTKSGYNHIYRYDWQSATMTALSAGKYDVENICGMDEAHKLVYYTAAENTATERKLYVCDWNGEHKACLTKDAGNHSITPCKGFHYFLDRYSTITTVPVYYLINDKGERIRTLEDNKGLIEKMKNYAFGQIKLLKIKGAENKLNAWMISPPNFDSTKKYPVLMYQYSGPGSQEVQDKFPINNYFWHQMMAQKGYIIICVDGRGTGFRGEAFKNKTYLQLGKYESEDQIAVAKTIGEWPFVDKSRIGIWGWSYGGFMSTTCLLKGNDVFKMAVAVAPVTSWRYYDNIYTERYMRKPSENAAGYDDNAPVKMADRLKGNYLLVQGTADDNVHMQNAVMLIDALIKADKTYDSEFYPNKNHGISGGNTRLHLFRRITDFIEKNL